MMTPKMTTTRTPGVMRAGATTKRGSHQRVGAVGGSPFYSRALFNGERISRGRIRQAGRESVEGGGSSLGPRDLAAKTSATSAVEPPSCPLILPIDPAAFAKGAASLEHGDGLPYPVKRLAGGFTDSEECTGFQGWWRWWRYQGL